ncbi:MAG: arginase [Betaproteobacteria bacterium]
MIEIIGAAWGLGGADPSCADAPGVLAPMLAQRLKECGIATRAGPTLSPSRTERRRELAVSKLCGLLASAVAESIRQKRLPCVLGGDHSCAGGTWTGVARTLSEKRAGSLGLVWIDAHMDAHTPGTSHSGRLHGMPLAWLLGQDDDSLYGLASGVVQPANVCLLGVRSYEPEEDARLKRLGVRVIMMQEIAARRLDDVLAEALAIATDGTGAFGLSIDLDAVTPEDAPGVATPVAGGIPGEALAAALAGIGGHDALAAVELVEYSPSADREARAARAAVAILQSALCGPRQDAQVVADALQRQHP